MLSANNCPCTVQLLTRQQQLAKSAQELRGTVSTSPLHYSLSHHKQSALYQEGLFLHHHWTTHCPIISRVHSIKRDCFYITIRLRTVPSSAEHTLSRGTVSTSLFHYSLSHHQQSSLYQEGLFLHHYSITHCPIISRAHSRGASMRRITSSVTKSRQCSRKLYIAVKETMSTSVQQSFFHHTGGINSLNMLVC